MTEREKTVQALILRAASEGVTLRLALGADGIEYLTPSLLKEVQDFRQDIITALARQSVSVIHRKPDFPLKSRPRPKWRPSEDPYADKPRQGDFCENCGGQTFYRLNEGWACIGEFPPEQYLNRNSVHWSQDCR